MDVRCDRCGTEYEFDDALVSERGTSVKCTSCGYQFKVFRQRVLDSPDHWLVKTADGRELVFYALRELQKAILARQVERTDMLSRGGGPMRALGAIPELSPFFDDAGRGAQQGRERFATPPGLGGPLVGGPMPLPSVVPPAARSVDARQGARTLSGVAPMPAPNSRVALPQGPLEIEPPTTKHVGSTQALPAQLPAIVAPPAAPKVSEPEATSDANLRSSGDLSLSGAGHSMFDEPASIPTGNKSGAGRWIVAVVALGTLAAVAGTVGRQALSDAVKPASSAEAPDGRVKDLLAQGDRALAEGDLEHAQEHFIKASALAEQDPRVLVGLARLSAMRADIPWLRLKLLPESAQDAQLVAKRELADAAARAKSAADRASEAAPDDLAVTRVKIDALRLLDDRAVAKALTPRLSTSASSPESAYVLAALEMSEPQPSWKPIIERLLLAATAETSPGRVRAALVYALAKSGDLVAAKTEFERLVSSPRPYALIPELRAMLSEAAPSPDKVAGAATAEATKAQPSATVAPSSTVTDINALPSVTSPAPATGGYTPTPREQPAGGEEFSESELHKKLLGDHASSGGGEVTVPKTENKPAESEKPKAPSKPNIDTSDLPGVEAP